MELRQYLALLRKWAWLIVLTTVIAAVSSYYYSRTIPPTYRAETTILVGQLQQNTNMTASDMYVATNLPATYAQLATQPPVLQAAAETIQWPDTWQTLYFHVSATAPGGQILKIAATSSSPSQAKQIADEVARQLILQSPISAQQKQAAEDRDFVTGQQEILRNQIVSGQKTLTDLNNQSAIENDPQKLADLNARVVALQTKIDDWQKNYASLAAILGNGTQNFMTVLAPAQEPAAPASPNIPQNVLFAALAGLVLAGGAILLLEYLDDTIKSSDDVQRVLRLPTLGAISRIRAIRKPTDHVITAKDPRSPISEAYRVLRTNLRFSGIENPSGVLLLTSAGPGEGKTTTAANLATAMAQSGKRVVLVDADLRRPSLHRLFGLDNSTGLSSLFLDDAPSLGAILQATATEGLRVLTSGPLPPNPAEILDSEKMNGILSELRAESDMVVLDSPPVLAVADASILSGHASGAVLVVDSGRTRSDVCQRAVETLRQTEAKILGVVLNKLSGRRSSGYYHYYYYYSDGRRKEKSKGQGVKKHA